MSEKGNQHFVPQFYFKHFTGGDPRIHLLLTATGRVVLDASIKGQCARHKFYGPKEIEDAFAPLEACHASAIRSAIRVGWDPDAPRLTAEQLVWLMGAVLFQRNRTLLEVEKSTPATESFLLLAFKAHVASAPGIENKEELLQMLDSGEFIVSENPQATICRAVKIGLESSRFIADLGVHLLLNHTSYPFIFSDAPVVFVNTYLRNVSSQGVLGLQTPGLQIFMPLDSKTLLMLLDEKVYSGYYKECPIVDVVEPSDVSQMNALQLHHSLNAVYFSNRADADYVERLWQAHKPNIVAPKHVFRILKNARIDGKPHAGELCHTFEPQLNFRSI